MSQYVRPQWANRPSRFSDGTVDPEFSECPSCLAFHAPSNIACNGKREPSTLQCPITIGEVRCHRPANHLGSHQALSTLLRIEWETFLP